MNPVRPTIRRLAIHRLSLKLALIVAAAAAGLVLIGLGLGQISVGLGVGVVLVVGAVTYATAYRLLARRLALARTILQQTRRHQFENLPQAHIAQGDELSDLIRQVYRTGQALEKEIRELKKMENYRREFMGNVSHELKTPIFAVQGFAETLLDGALDDQRVNRSFLQKILHNANRLGNLVRDLGEISRIETGELEIAKKPFDLQRLVKDVVESMEPIAQGKDIQLRTQVAPQLPHVIGDRDLLQQVLINLVDNAIKYNNPGGHVEVLVRLLPSDEVKITVVDDGIGIASQHIPRLTERFYRVDKSRSRQQGGTGLGLAIVKHIIGAHDRRLLIESHPGRGSTFSFTIDAASGE